MSNTRKAITYREEDSAITILKPFSDEYKNHLIVVNEDAYGEFSGELILKTELKKKLSLSDEEFYEMINKL